MTIFLLCLFAFVLLAIAVRIINVYFEDILDWLCIFKCCCNSAIRQVCKEIGELPNYAKLFYCVIAVVALCFCYLNYWF
jgi:hypothetical protein